MRKLPLPGMLAKLSGLIVCFLIAGSAVRADIVPIAPNTFVAGIRSDEFRYFAAPEVAGRQRQSNWCWAACVQMVLNYHGLIVNQEEVVQRVFGRQIDQPADNSQILLALSGWAPDFRGRFSAITAIPYAWNGSLISDLAYKWPLIAGLKNADGSGHAYVLTALQYHNENYVMFYRYGFCQGRVCQQPVYGQRTVFDYVFLRDPWPSNESLQKWTWSQFQANLLFLDGVHVIRLP